MTSTHNVARWVRAGGQRNLCYPFELLFTHPATQNIVISSFEQLVREAAERDRAMAAAGPHQVKRRRKAEESEKTSCDQANTNVAESSKRMTLVVGRPGCGKSSLLSISDRFESDKMVELNNDIPCTLMPGFEKNYELCVDDTYDLVSDNANAGTRAVGSRAIASGRERRTVAKYLTWLFFHEPNSTVIRPKQVDNLLKEGLLEHVYHSNVLSNPRHFQVAENLLDVAQKNNYVVDVFTVELDPPEDRRLLLEARKRREIKRRCLMGGNYDRSMVSFEADNASLGSDLDKLRAMLQKKGVNHTWQASTTKVDHDLLQRD